jgi:hypothetical protein
MLLKVLLLLLQLLLPSVAVKGGPSRSSRGRETGPLRVGLVKGCPGIEHKDVVPDAVAREAANHDHPPVIEEAGRVTLLRRRRILTVGIAR